MYLSLAWQLKPRGRERESEVSTTSAAVLGWAQKQLIASTSLDWMLKGAKSTSRITCPVVGASPGWRRTGWTSGGRGTEHLVILSFLCVRIMLASPEIYCWRIYLKYICVALCRYSGGLDCSWITVWLFVLQVVDFQQTLLKRHTLFSP